ncbi:hypothetical protein CW304_08025 [Bacillus sp. UFRGS-B20]|nr:hypothetical protein CW304_08025 [Bacillus sp. UFRGS-B20]
MFRRIMIRFGIEKNVKVINRNDSSGTQLVIFHMPNPSFSNQFVISFRIVYSGICGECICRGGKDKFWLLVKQLFGFNHYIWAQCSYVQ